MDIGYNTTAGLFLDTLAFSFNQRSQWPANGCRSEPGGESVTLSQVYYLVKVRFKAD